MSGHRVALTSPILVPYREMVCLDTPLPSIKLKREPLHKLVPIEAVTGPSQSKEEYEMEECSIMKARLESLTVLKFKEVLANKGMEYIYNWVDDEGGWHKEYDKKDIKKSEWLNDPDFLMGHK